MNTLRWYYLREVWQKRCLTNWDASLQRVDDRFDLTVKLPSHHKESFGFSFPKGDGTGSGFSVVASDLSGKIRLVSFGDSADHYSNLLKPGKVMPTKLHVQCQT